MSEDVILAENYSKGWVPMDGLDPSKTYTIIARESEWTPEVGDWFTAKAKPGRNLKDSGPHQARGVTSHYVVAGDKASFSVEHYIFESASIPKE